MSRSGILKIAHALATSGTYGRTLFQNKANNLRKNRDPDKIAEVSGYLQVELHFQVTISRTLGKTYAQKVGIDLLCGPASHFQS